MRLCSIYDSIIAYSYLEHYLNNASVTRKLYKYISNSPNYQLFNLGFKHFVDCVVQYVKQYRSLYRSNVSLLNRVKQVHCKLIDFFCFAKPSVSKPNGINMRDAARLMNCFAFITSDSV